MKHPINSSECYSLIVVGGLIHCSHIYPVTSPLVFSASFSALQQRRPRSLSSSSGTGPQPAGGSSVSLLNHLDLTIVELFAASPHSAEPAHSISNSSLERYLLYVERRLALRSNSNCDLGGEMGLASPFPVVMLSYADLVEACDTMQFLAARRHDAVLVFAPNFLIGNKLPFPCLCLRVAKILL